LKVQRNSFLASGDGFFAFHAVQKIEWLENSEEFLFVVSQLGDNREFANPNRVVHSLTGGNGERRVLLLHRVPWIMSEIDIEWRRDY
jgi:hypothetical protein